MTNSKREEMEYKYKGRVSSDDDKRDCSHSKRVQHERISMNSTSHEKVSVVSKRARERSERPSGLLKTRLSRAETDPKKKILYIRNGKIKYITMEEGDDRVDKEKVEAKEEKAK